jgi:hypothetical protein
MGKLGATIAKYCVRPTMFIALAGFALPASSDQNVRYLKYENCGAVSRVMLNYKNSDMTENKSFKIGTTVKGTYKLLSDPGAVCVDLTDERYGDIDDGAEVWLSIKIESGDNESCKKDTKRIKDSGTKMELFKTAGQTQTNNRCKSVAVYTGQSANQCQPVSDSHC